MTTQVGARAFGGVPVLVGLLTLAGCGTASDGSAPLRPAGAGDVVAAADDHATPVASPSPTAQLEEVAATATALWAANPPPTPRTTDPPLGGIPAPGVPAIRPSRPSTGPNDPAFTEQDVRDFVERYGADGARLIATGPVVVTRVVFVPGATVGWSAYPLLCLVTVRGDYRLSGGPAPPPGATPRPPIVFESATLIFDAHTGNALGTSAPAWATPLP
jgi:hypothetical protein